MADEGEKEKRTFAKDFLEKWAKSEDEGRPAEEVLKEVEAAIERSPDDPRLWLRKGVLLSELGRWEDSLAALRKAESLNPRLPRLQGALAFVLGRLGRTEEAAEADRRALETPAGPPPEEEGVRDALESLTDELEDAKAAEVEEIEAVEDLETLAPLAHEDAAEATYERRLATWEAAGYDVTTLRKTIAQDPDRVRTAFFQFDQNVRKIQILEDTVQSLDPRGLEADIARVRSLFRSPYQIWRIEAEMATLLEKADARDRADRAKRVLPSSPRPGAVSRPKTEPRVRTAPSPQLRGAINGLAKGRVNGLATGRVNGLATGRVNGLAAGHVNGLVNGVQRARAGITNGLTNGSGMTNGLGGPRSAVETRKGKWRLYLVPIAATLLLSVTLFDPTQDAPALGGISIDHFFSDWERIPGYVQDSSTTNPNVDLRTYKVWLQDNRLSIYANVSGTWFSGSTGVEQMYAFVDADGDRFTGYDEGGIGANLLLEVYGSNKTILGQNAWSWSGTDQDNWTAWQGIRAPRAALGGSKLEVQLDLTDILTLEPSSTAVVLYADDQEGSRSISQIAFGPTYGALEVTQAAVSTTVEPSSSAAFLNVTFHAVGTGATVDGLTFDDGGITPNGFSSFTLAEGEIRTITMTVDTSGFANSTLLSADLVAVDADRTVVIHGAPARAYVSSVPGGRIIDGFFTEWAAAFNDTDPVSNPNVDIQRFASEGQIGATHIYARVRGTALGGSAHATARVEGGPAQAAPAPPPGIPERRIGEDLIRVYFDTNATDDGHRLGGIVADTILDIRGRNGRVRAVEGSTWQSARWVRGGTGEAIVSGPEIEASLAVTGVDLRGADFLIEARDWRGTTDRTAVEGVRGTRSSPGGVTFVRGYEATVPRTADGVVTFDVPSRGSVSWRLPQLLVAGNGRETPLASPNAIPAGIRESGATYLGAYAGIDAGIKYEAEDRRLKETITIFAPLAIDVADTLVIESSLTGYDDLLVSTTGKASPDGLLIEGDFVLTDGRGFSIAMSAPWAEDDVGRHLDLRYRWRDGALAVLVPGRWLADAAYPVVVDPTTYQFENDGPSEDVGENFGWSTAMGDFNNDGFADLLTGAPVNNLDGSFHGYAYVFFGPLDANDTIPDVRIRGTAAGGRHGWSVAAGDFNGDGFWDALVASKSLDASTGNTSIYYGSSSWAGLEQTPDVNFTWPSGPKNFGWWVAAGNIDNVNADDVLIGEPNRDNDGGLLTSDGVVHVFMSPFGAVETAGDFTLKPSTNGNGQFGYSIAVARIDSDAFADVVVGEPFLSAGGRVHFFRGSNMTSGGGNRLPEAVLSAQSSGEKFGQAVAAGVISGDAYADVLVGAPGKTVGGTVNTGGAYVFVANANGTGLTTGASPSATLSNQSSAEQFGFAVLVTDFDDDGSAGAFVGAPFADAGGTDRGRAHWFDAPTTDQVVDDTVSGTQNSELLGSALAAARFASDLRTRVAIGAYRWDDNASNPGDNDGRVLLADVPEPVSLFIPMAIAIVLGARSLHRRRLIRKR